MENKKLPKIAKTFWIEALRSEDFTQCRYQLHAHSGGHCCIGVLDVVIMGYPEGPHNLDAYQLLDQSVGAETTQRLVGMNDRGKSFSEIADWIEQNL